MSETATPQEVADFFEKAAQRVERLEALNAELLAALKIARDGFYVAGDNYAEAFNQIEAAIAKAEGQK